MKRDFLKELGLSDDVINQIMAENGRDIQNAKSNEEKLVAENEQFKADLQKANETLEKFKDYDNVKADVEKYKADAEKSKTEYEQKIAKMELQAKIKDFTGSKRFVNELTRNAINSNLETLLNDEANKGKSLEELLVQITDGQENIFVEENSPKPPVTSTMTQKQDSEKSGVLEAFMKMNPNVKVDE